MITEERDPVRITTADDLEDAARQLAAGLRPIEQRYDSPVLLNRLGQHHRQLTEAYRHFARASREDRVFSSAAEWILDNFYLIQQSVRQVREDLPRSYYQQLPKLPPDRDAGIPTGYPRIFLIAREFIRYTGGALAPDKIVRYVEAYQDAAPLTMGELWAFPTMLRMAILENLAGAVTRIARPRPEEGESRPASHDADARVVAGSVTALRILGTQDWKDFFESVSRVERTLREDPARVYAHMEFETRDRYRKEVERLARNSGCAEESVAREAVLLARTAAFESLGPSGRAGPETHIGFHILHAGRPLLEQRIGYRPGYAVRLRNRVREQATWIYLGSITLLTLLLLVPVPLYLSRVGGSLAQQIAAALLFLIPASTVAVSFINWFVTRVVPPNVLPKMDFSSGIPVEHRAMVVIPALLTDANEVHSLLKQLEGHYLSNADPHLGFALLSDFADAPNETMPEDDNLLQLAQSGIQALNETYGTTEYAPFYLFHRRRIWNPVEECWMGRERKRGKLHEFNRLLRGASDTTYDVQTGDLEVLSGIRYVITLDADTNLPDRSAHRLVATLAHPLNCARFDRENGDLTAGYTVLQPRVEIKPPSSNRSRFTRIFAGDTGLDLYTRAVSDVYQDLFGDGIFVGKGIYEVDGFERTLHRRVPDNALLSHDLFEGIHGRVGLVTDIMLLEDYPPHYLAYMRRAHRWIRGDWQLLPWLFPTVPHAGPGRIRNRLPALAGWKIVDNLRRSLVAPALLALLFAAWFWLQGSPWIWTLMVLATPGFPLLTSLFNRFGRRSGGFGSHILEPVGREILRWVLALVFLPYEALIALDAILSTLKRLFITRRGLLQWTTAAHSVILFGREVTLELAWRQMGIAAIFAGTIGILAGLHNPKALPVAIPLLIGWLLSPQIAYWTSRPTVDRVEKLTPRERRELRRLACRTWLFFERFVGPDDHWLPPDHFQETPLGVVAHRTSPTNIGLFMLASTTAFDLGYIGTSDLTLRLRSLFDTLDRLEKYRGHLLNWYDTRTLQPLHPRYVSTVDSGNLAACLIILHRTCLSLCNEPAMRCERWDGLIDALGLLAHSLSSLHEAHSDSDTARLVAHLRNMQEDAANARNDTGRWAATVLRLKGERWRELDQLLVELIESRSLGLDVAVLGELRVYSEFVRHHLHRIQRRMNRLVPWLNAFREPPPLLAEQKEDIPGLSSAWQKLRETLSTIPATADLPRTCQAARSDLARIQVLLRPGPDAPERMREARDWCTHLDESLKTAAATAEELLGEYRDLARHADALFQETEFRFLFDERRRLFHIGYNVDAGELDANYYDLLASESRITSYVAIAKNDVPLNHWMHLGRPLTKLDGKWALISWSGTMFEYLMPDLLMRSYPDTLLDASARAVVDYQVRYGLRRDLPWGMSESGYYRFDTSQAYQYRAFGTSGLGFKRGLAEDVVVAPYASVLAVARRPRAVMENLYLFARLGMIGRYGLYEAIDFTSSRLPQGEKYKRILSYMSHHQGMILLSLGNYLGAGPILRHFHDDPRMQTKELLLQEQVPRDAQPQSPPAEESQDLRPKRPLASLAPWRVPEDAPLPLVHALSNGRYGVVVSSAGGGFSFWNNLELTRWRADATLDNWGTWIYVHDLDADALWSVALQPTGAPAENQETLFGGHSVEFRRRFKGLLCRTEIVVSPDEDVEIRRVTLINDSDSLRSLAVTSYGEPVLASKDDLRHPAFNKLFIESEYLPEWNTLLFRRRPRSEEEGGIFLAHAVISRDGLAGTAHFESSRAQFLGRCGTTRAPAALRNGQPPLSGAEGATLDPIFSVGRTIALEAHESVELAFVTAAGKSREQALEWIKSHHSWLPLERAFQHAKHQSEVEARQLGLGSVELARIQQLLSALVYPHAALRPEPALLAANSKGQPGLWAFGISGDYPILLVRASDPQDLSLVHQMLQAHAYWRNRSIKATLVILNEHDTSYMQELSEQLTRMLGQTGNEIWLNRHDGIFILRSDQLPHADRVLLETAARVVLDSRRGTLANQLGRLFEGPARLPAFGPSLLGSEGTEETPAVGRPDDLLYDNGLGGFSAGGREYVVYLEPGQRTPAPWVNVIANPEFGFLISESGAGFTWAENSAENRLTPWQNDPVTDGAGEALYLRDEESAKIWSTAPAPAGAPLPHLIRHGAGYTIIEHQSHGLYQRMRCFTPPDAPVKIVQLQVRNIWKRPRRITATYYAEWVLGTTREATQQFIVPEFDSETGSLLARNPYNVEFGQRVAFLSANREPHGITADRTEFLGRMGSLRDPAALYRIGLASAIRAGGDICAALQLHLDLAAGQSEEIYFLLGQGRDREQTLQLIRRYKDPAQVEAAWRETTAFWDRILGAITVRTPDPAMDVMLNRWLLYQALSCRVWGRSGLYQSSGALGYRDQLQDVMALTQALPEAARDHILDAARHQFEAGDVLHWWQPPSGRGVRTRCSDDLLWLPFVTAHYVATTGDHSVLRERVPFLKGDPLKPDEAERYSYWPSTHESYTLYEHCRRAIQKGQTTGPHRLPLIGSGDWNDGFNLVGIGGKGESVWLGWFLHATLVRFLPLSDFMGDFETSAAFRKLARDLRRTLESKAWDGDWYLRAFYDDRSPLGSAQNRECRIDSIAQSWAVLSGAADPQRAMQAMQAVSGQLVRQEHQLILLFTPPFNRTARSPGYVKGYPPGIRENGGQYTHAAIWAVWAFAELGQGDRAAELFRFINPVSHNHDPQSVSKYAVEPYVVAADVYSVAPHEGRGGWTWYTGSAGWMWRLGIEAILGLRRQGNSLRINPCISSDWPGFSLIWREKSALYHIQVDNPERVNRGVRQITLDGKKLDGDVIPLLDDGARHEIAVLMGNND